MTDFIWEPKAIDDLVDIAASDHRQARRIGRAVSQLSAGSSRDTLKLQGDTDRWRLRVGDWRVIFARDGGTFRILCVVNRRDAYR